MKTDEKYRIESSIAVEKKPLELWNTLIEFSNYRAWNPIVNHAAIYGPVSEGTDIKILSGKWDLRFYIVDASPPVRLVIDGGSVGLKLKLRLTISPEENGSLVSIETSVDGWMTRIFPKKIKRNIEESLELFLSALKRRVSSGDTYEIKRGDEKTDDEDDRRSFSMPTPFNLIYKTRKKRSPGRRPRLR
ncbi:MAG: SRPBCC family protein [Candidatus Zixiibacteriota bacterium]|nr:MAG: SRPBCC family protein [candidate division Zixibacteria bacterium]